MNSQEQLRERILANDVDFLCVAGSRLFGTNKEGSDYDYRGFILPGFDYLIGINRFDDMDVPGADHKVFALKRFLDLIVGGDPSLTELLFAPKDKIIKITPIGQTILDNRESLVSNRIYDKISGYARNEWRKAFAEKLLIEGRTPTEDTWVEDAKNLFPDWDKEKMDKICGWIIDGKPKRIVPSKKDLGEKRKKELEAYGFVVSQAAHSLRLVGEVIELMLTGNITFPRPNAKWLLSIRQGKVSKEEVQAKREQLVYEAEEARKKSILPDKPNVPAIMSLYGELVREYLKKTL